MCFLTSIYAPLAWEAHVGTCNTWRSVQFRHGAPYNNRTHHAIIKLSGPWWVILYRGVAQLGACMVWDHKVVGSYPTTPTILILSGRIWWCTTIYGQGVVPTFRILLKWWRSNSPHKKIMWWYTTAEWCYCVTSDRDPINQGHGSINSLKK